MLLAARVVAASIVAAAAAETLGRELRRAAKRGVSRVTALRVDVVFPRLVLCVCVRSRCPPAVAVSSSGACASRRPVRDAQSESAVAVALRCTAHHARRRRDEAQHSTGDGQDKYARHNKNTTQHNNAATRGRTQRAAQRSTSQFDKEEKSRAAHTRHLPHHTQTALAMLRADSLALASSSHRVACSALPAAAAACLPACLPALRSLWLRCCLRPAWVAGRLHRSRLLSVRPLTG